MKATCPACRRQITVSHRAGMMLACGLTGAVLGKAATRHPAGAVLCSFLGFLIGNAIDSYLNTHCPHCGTVLRIVGPFLT